MGYFAHEPLKVQHVNRYVMQSRPAGSPRAEIRAFRNWLHQQNPPRAILLADVDLTGTPLLPFGFRSDKTTEPGEWLGGSLYRMDEQSHMVEAGGLIHVYCCCLWKTVTS
jgi:hypothetical protein